MKNPMRNKVRVELNRKKKYVYTNHSEEFGFREISSLINFLNNIKRRHKLSLLPIVINLGNITFADKLSYIVLECICYNLIVKENCKLSVYYKNKTTIDNAGIDSSCIKSINRDKDLFVKMFGFESYMKHFRRIIKCENRGGENLGYLTQDIEAFLNLWEIDDECSSDISMVVGELVDNALEHSNSDCLIDIDVTRNYWKTEDGDIVYGVNIVILNFSDILFHENLMKKFDEIKDAKLEIPLRYKNAEKAREYHSMHWNEHYTEDDFFTITAFQDKISGRESTNNTGGRGLTQLIKAIEEKADSSHCYILSGDKAIRFIKEYLLQNEEQWVGFNESSNYLTDVPKEECMYKSMFFMPGTAYNLTFVLKKEENDNEQN